MRTLNQDMLEKVERYITTYQMEKGKSPSYRQIMHETGYWLELAYRTNYIDAQQYKILSDKCAALRVMLVSSCRTAKSNIDNK